MGSTVFNHIAEEYDQGFTNSLVGSAQRKAVFYFFDQLKTKNLKVFEINGGTGEDACLLAERENEVLTSDVSPEMVAIAKDKIENRRLSAKAKAKVFDLQSDDWPTEQFNMIWSNFGGLNCLSEQDLSNLSVNAKNSLESNAYLFAVVMGDKCIWEMIFYSLKLDFKKAFRRFGGKRIDASIGNGKTIPTWYYSDRHFASIFSSEFEHVASYPIGFFVPPSYLEKRMNQFPTFFRCLKWLDNQVRRTQFLARFADHFLIIMKRK